MLFKKKRITDCFFCRRGISREQRNIRFQRWFSEVQLPESRNKRLRHEAMTLARCEEKTMARNKAQQRWERLRKANNLSWWHERRLIPPCIKQLYEWSPILIYVKHSPCIDIYIISSWELEFGKPGNSERFVPVASLQDLLTS